MYEVIVVFLLFSEAGTKKRVHLDLNKSSLIEDSITIPEPICFTDFRKDFNNDFTLVDFAESLGACLDSNQKRE